MKNWLFFWIVNFVSQIFFKSAYFITGKLFSRRSSSIARSLGSLDAANISIRLTSLSLSSSAIDWWKSNRFTLCRSRSGNAGFRVGSRILFSSWKSDIALSGSSQFMRADFKCWLSCSPIASRPIFIFDIFHFFAENEKNINKCMSSIWLKSIRKLTNPKKKHNQSNMHKTKNTSVTIKNSSISAWCQIHTIGLLNDKKTHDTTVSVFISKNRQGRDFEKTEVLTIPIHWGGFLSSKPSSPFRYGPNPIHTSTPTKHLPPQLYEIFLSTIIMHSIEIQFILWNNFAVFFFFVLDIFLSTLWFCDLFWLCFRLKACWKLGTLITKTSQGL